MARQFKYYTAMMFLKNITYLENYTQVILNKNSKNQIGYTVLAQLH